MGISRTSLLLFTILFLSSCGKDSGNKSGHGDSLSSLEEISETGNVPTAASNFQVNVSFKDFDSYQKEKVLRAIELIKSVVATTDFRDRILKKTYNGVFAFFDNDGLSNKEIYRKILLAQEELSQSGANNAMDLELILYEDSSTTTIGYTYPNVSTIWINAKYLNSFQASDVADNLFHEWLHKLGFKHDTVYRTSRQHSVPYAIGYMVRDLARNYE